MTRRQIFIRLLLVLSILLVAGIFVLKNMEWRASTPPPPGAGRPVGQASQPQTALRVGTPGISMASLILALGGHRALAAITPEVRDNPWLARIVPEVATLPTPFSRPAGVNLEALLAVRPDLVTLWGGSDALGRQLTKLGIPVLYLTYRTPEEMKGAVRQLGQAMGDAASGQAEALIRAYDHNLQRVATALAGLPDTARPRVYYASLSPLHSEGSQSMINAWIEAAGGVNVAARGGLQGDGQVHLEDVLAWDPQIIVTLDIAQQQAILHDPRWRDISAVRHGQVRVNPKGINAWCTRAAEAVLQVLWAAKLFHPERLAEVDMASETRRFYRQFYTYALSDQELAHVLQGLPPPAPISATLPRKTS